jgi:hypothetical protein
VDTHKGDKDSDAYVKEAHKSSACMREEGRGGGHTSSAHKMGRAYTVVAMLLVVAVWWSWGCNTKATAMSVACCLSNNLLSYEVAHVSCWGSLEGFIW